jgi:hypothetical protein
MALVCGVGGTADSNFVDVCARSAVLERTWFNERQYAFRLLEAVVWVSSTDLSRLSDYQ